MRSLLLECPKCREMRVLRGVIAGPPPNCLLCGEPFLLWQVRAPACPQCDQETVQHTFLADGMPVTTHHCPQHGDVVVPWESEAQG